jgi:hypothetical protein
MEKLFTRLFWVIGLVASSGRAMAGEKTSGEAIDGTPPNLSPLTELYLAGAHRWRAPGQAASQSGGSSWL